MFKLKITSASMQRKNVSLCSTEKTSKQKTHNKTRATKHLDELKKMFMQFLTFLIQDISEVFRCLFFRLSFSQNEY